MQILRRIRDAVTGLVYDPELASSFSVSMDAKRGDIVLNPLDDPCPYWGPSEELGARLRRKRLHLSLPADQRQKASFHRDTAEDFAHCSPRPTPEIVAWLSNPRIDQRVPTRWSHDCQGARSSSAMLLASLGLVAEPLRMLPTREQQGTKRESTEWSENRAG